MPGLDYHQLPAYLTHRIGPLLIAIGAISIAQAAGFISFGSSEFPSAFIILTIGGILTLSAIAKNHKMVQIAQSVLALAAIGLIIVF